MSKVEALSPHKPLITLEKQVIVDKIIESINYNLELKKDVFSGKSFIASYATGYETNFPHHRNNPWAEQAVAEAFKKQGWLHVEYIGTSNPSKSHSIERWFLSTTESLNEYNARKSSGALRRKFSSFLVNASLVAILIAILTLVYNFS